MNNNLTKAKRLYEGQLSSPESLTVDSADKGITKFCWRIECPFALPPYCQSG